VAQSLDGPRLKLTRAKHHIRWLKQQVRRIKDDPHRVIEYPDAQSGGYRYEISDPDIDPKVGIVVGDAVHNLHTALDHVVWQLAQLNVGGKNAALDAGQEWPPNSAQFPIFKTPNGFKSDGRKMIACLSEPHREAIKDLQPCYRSSVPSSDPLWLLYAISITDKHHVLNASVIDLTDIPDAPFRAITINPETGDPVVGPDKAQRDRYDSMAMIVRLDVGQTTFEAEGKFPVEVAFRDPGSRFGRDIDRQPVIPLLDAAARDVEAIIASFESAFSK
jgi:hypothetical protein